MCQKRHELQRASPSQAVIAHMHPSIDVYKQIYTDISCLNEEDFFQLSRPSKFSQLSGLLCKVFDKCFRENSSTWIQSNFHFL